MIITCHLENNSIFDLNSSPIVLQRPVKEVGVAMNAPATEEKTMVRSMDNRCMLSIYSKSRQEGKKARAQEAGGSSTIEKRISPLFIPWLLVAPSTS